MILFDTHCHLFMDPLTVDPPAAYRRALAADVQHMMIAAYDLPSWQPVAALGVALGQPVALGVHPWAGCPDFDRATLARALVQCGARAVGEIGLDAAHTIIPLDEQERLLTAQLDVARELDLPVILHCVRAYDRLLPLLRRHTPRLRGVVHGFSRGPTLAKELLAENLMLGLGGAITRPRPAEAHATAKAIPLSELVLETDAPALPIHGSRFAHSEPADLPLVACALASLRQQPVTDIAQVTTENAKRLFGLV